jgi:FdhD protein
MDAPDQKHLRIRALRVNSQGASPVNDTLAREGVLHLRVNDIPYTTTVRTPGEDTWLARGLLFTEGTIPDPAAKLSFHAIADPETQLTGVLEVHVAPQDLAKPLHDRRSTMSSASCGLCGLREPEELQMAGAPVLLPSGERFPITTIRKCLDALHAAQDIFTATGGTHAAGLFDRHGRMLAICEDIGRHNAVDKAIGAVLEQGALPQAHLLLVSGRLSYEIVFKAFRARVPLMASVSAPSSLAVEMAKRFGLTLIAFCREDRCTVYSHPDRLDLETRRLQPEES